jgi:trans-2,3-dihydro-3-hydroxyanthranilate isomerase
MASHRFHILDVFTKVRFGGNQLAVVLDADDLDGASMQKIAREFNFSETTFICAPRDAGNTAHVRIFTPAAELPFAGHPIVGTALVLARLKETDSIAMEIKAGLVPVAVDGDHATFTAPVLPSPAGAAPDDTTLAAAVGLQPGDLGFDNHRPAFVAAGNLFLFVPVRDLAAVGRAKVDATHWPKVKGGHDIVGAYVYTRGGAAAETDYRVRLFAPDHGITEDPATGSAAATLPGQIIASEPLANGSHRWQLEQGYEMGRPSQITVDVEVAGGTITTVRVGGSAVVTASGSIES